MRDNIVHILNEDVEKKLLELPPHIYMMFREANGTYDGEVDPLHNSVYVAHAKEKESKLLLDILKRCEQYSKELEQLKTQSILNNNSYWAE